MEPEDLLNFENNGKIKQKLGNEKIMYSDKIQKKKFGFFGKFQDRILLITNKAIYNFKKTEIKRRIKIEDLYGITYSRQSNEFILHFNKNDYDYLFKSEKRNKIILLLQQLYESIKNQDILFTAKIEKDLSKYAVTKKERKGNPYLFKMDKSDLISIKEFFENAGESTNQGNNNDDFEELKNDENADQEQEQEQEKPKPKGMQMPKFTPPSQNLQNLKSLQK